MGGARQDRYEQVARGYSHIDGFVCSAHVIDPVLLSSLDTHPPATCEACDRTDQSVVSLDALAGGVKDAIDYFWEPGYFGHDYERDGSATSTRDVLENICGDAFTKEASAKIISRIETAIDAVSAKSGWLHDRQSVLKWSWELFSHNVRYTNRFVFAPEGTKTSTDPAPHSTAEWGVSFSPDSDQ